MVQGLGFGYADLSDFYVGFRVKVWRVQCFRVFAESM